MLSERLKASRESIWIILREVFVWRKISGFNLWHNFHKVNDDNNFSLIRRLFSLSKVFMRNFKWNFAYSFERNFQKLLEKMREWSLNLKQKQKLFDKLFN